MPCGGKAGFGTSTGEPAAAAAAAAADAVPHEALPRQGNAAHIS